MSPISIVVSKSDANAVISGFQRLSKTMARKYMKKAVGNTAKNFIPSLKSITPKHRGGLRSSVAGIVDKPEKKLKGTKFAKFSAVTVYGRLGFRRGKTSSGRSRGGNHSHWLEDGVAERIPKKKTVFRINYAKNRKYRYLKQFVVSSVLFPQTASPKRKYNVYLPKTAPIKGRKFFKKYLAIYGRVMTSRLKRELSRGLKSAIAETSLKSALRAAKRP